MVLGTIYKGQEKGCSSLFKSDWLVTWTPKYSLFYNTVYSTVYTAHCTLYTVHCKLYRTANSELYNFGIFPCSHMSEMTVPNRPPKQIYLKLMVVF